MTGAHSYCRPCDAWYREARGRSCPTCGAALEQRTFRYPEDVFGPPLPGEAPIASRDVKPREGAGSRGAGVGLLLAGHIVFVMLAGLPPLGLAIFFIGITQLVYAIPMMIACGTRGKHRTVSGIALGIGLTFLLNAACFGVVCGGGL